MNELQEQTPHPELIPKDTKILCVCEHGNSRSKFVAQALGKLGYEHARVLGIRDNFFTRREKLAMMKQHDLIVCASGTTQSEVEKLMLQQPELATARLVNLEMSEQLHSKLYALLKGVKLKNSDVTKELAEIIAKLNSLGFA